MPQSLPQDRKGFGARRDVAGAGRSRAAAKAWLGRVSKAFLTVFALAAAGCSTRSDLGFMTLMSEVPATQAIIVPPPGGPAVVAVLQRRYQNGVSQEIALSTASMTLGQNAFYVSMVNDPETLSEIDDTLRIRPLTPEIIQAEMEERFPGIDMRTSLLYAQNKYGPFGFATGRSATGDLCLYAWQQIEPSEPAIFMTHGAISLRLRLCDADATEAQLLRTMYAFTIPAYFMSSAWNPYGAPPPPPAYLGQMNAPINPLAIGATEGLLGSRPRSLAPARRVIVQESVEPARAIVDKDTVLPEPAQPDVPSAPLSGYPVVPPPPPAQ
ncbi:cellulose biosynthesis protein BcsN [Microvirga lenta]|uniref:cellulose biosynthesis protein BcsN n=1 Tax=Microvirga lenta TaxID=2881337 RepID=UPI001CFFABF5|nr:cellulose biosynthesis protein BcsN [Microvirga lenta]MCB5175083.1 cellulose biosynthesis protein BcsN [Microvirga lenta]